MSLVRNAIKPALCLALAGSGAQSAVADGLYFGIVGVEKQTTSISDSNFSNYSLALQAGRWLKPGIGVQVGATLAASDDTKGSVDLSLQGLYTAGIRLEGNMAERRGAAAFVAAGFASAKIDANSAFDNSSDWYHGYFATAGLMVGLTRQSQLSFTYSYHAVDPAVSIPALQLGYRFQF